MLKFTHDCDIIITANEGEATEVGSTFVNPGGIRLHSQELRRPLPEPEDGRLYRLQQIVSGGRIVMMMMMMTTTTTMITIMTIVVVLMTVMIEA